MNPYPEPEEICEDGANEDYWCSSYMIDGAQYDWNTNYTFITGEPTLPMEFCHGSGRLFNIIPVIFKSSEKVDTIDLVLKFPLAPSTVLFKQNLNIILDKSPGKIEL